jgi:hypothetical protein
MSAIVNDWMLTQGAFSVALQDDYSYWNSCYDIRYLEPQTALEWQRSRATVAQ